MRCDLFAVWMIHLSLAACVCLGIASQFLGEVTPLKLLLVWLSSH